MLVSRKQSHPFGLVVPLVLTVFGVSACGGGERPAADSAMMDTTMAAPPSTSAAPASEAAMIATGDSIFKGQIAGGLCFTCHGVDAKGTTLAPDLTDQTWINTDGTLEGIVTIVTNGVPQPKQHPAPMLPMGGGQLTPDQIRAVATYVYSLSHP